MTVSPDLINHVATQSRNVVLRTGLSWFQWEWKDFCKDTNATRASPSQHGTFGACKTGYGEGVRALAAVTRTILVVESPGF